MCLDCMAATMVVLACIGSVPAEGLAPQPGWSCDSRFQTEVSPSAHPSADDECQQRGKVFDAAELVACSLPLLCGQWSLPVSRTVYLVPCTSRASHTLL